MRSGSGALVVAVLLGVTAPAAAGQVDGPTLGMPAQGGDSHFLQRFALAPHDGFDPARAMRFALEHQNPLVAGRVRGGSVYPGETFSLVSIDSPEVLLWSLKPAEEGVDQGIVARVWNLAARELRFTLSLAPGLETAVQTTHIETDRAAVPVSTGVLSTTAARSQLLTYRLRPAISRPR